MASASPSKRTLTIEAYTDAHAPNVVHSSTPADLALALRNLGSRVRKSVTEGYRNASHTSSAPSSPSNPFNTRTDIFTSSNDIIRNTFISPRPPVSPRKRGRVEEDGDDGSEEEDRDPEPVTAVANDDFWNPRPIKAKPRRKFLQTKSLPTDIFGSSAHSTEEADWSMDTSQPPDSNLMDLRAHKAQARSPALRPPSFSMRAVLMTSWIWIGDPLTRLTGTFLSFAATVAESYKISSSFHSSPALGSGSRLRHDDSLPRSGHHSRVFSNRDDATPSCGDFKLRPASPFYLSAERDGWGSERAESSGRNLFRDEEHRQHGDLSGSEPPPLFAIDTPTATYMWPPLKPASQMTSGPILVSDPRRSMADSGATSGPSRSVRMTSAKRQSSPAYLESTEPTSSDIGPPPKQERWDLLAQSPPLASSSHQEPPTIGSSPEPTGFPLQGWQKHAVCLDGHNAFRCVWITPRGPCGYTSKKQLVKRHIETTHLKIKPFICSFCQKTFPQKCSLVIHEDGHTGKSPHECRFKCGLWFRDPARRHRHHVDVHGHKANKFKRQQSSYPTSESATYETMPPFQTR